MKRCPTCQKTFADSMKFCQTDGTPLVEDQASAPLADPYKTVVGSIKDDDLLQIPDSYDPMKTMVGSSDSAPKVTDSPKPKEEPKDLSSDTSSKSDAATVITPIKPIDSSLNPPSFGNLSSSPSSSSDSVTSSKPKNFDATFSSMEPPAFGPPKKGDTAPFGKPSDIPFGSLSKDDAPPTAFGDSRFDAPKSSVPPPYKEPEPFNPGGQTPFGGQQSNDPWGTPQTPYGQQANDPFAGGQAWSPPPAPVANWQDQGLGANTPFQPPAGTAGQDQTLAIVSLVCGILSLCVCGILSGIPALITGYMARNNVDSNPGQYGGRGMATAGMILGGISVVFTVLYIAFVIITAIAR